MAGNWLFVQCKRKPTIAGLVNFNATANHYIGGCSMLSSVTLAVILCLPDHTITVQSSTVDRVEGKLLDITNTLEVGIKGRKHGENAMGL
jgi:hypothetical protein